MRARIQAILTETLGDTAYLTASPVDDGSEPSRPIDPLPSHGDPDARPRIDLADRDAVWDVLDGR